MKNLAVFFGGKACEHDVSIITGHQAMDNADAAKYHVVPVYISQDGKWYTGEKLRDLAFFKAFDASAVTQVYMEPNEGDTGLYPCHLKAGLLGAKSREPLVKLDVALLAMHGLHGEGGILQGIFEMNGLPYTSTGVMGSAVGMNKITMRYVFKGAGLPVLDMAQLDRDAYQADPEGCLDMVTEKIKTWPMFIKPANLGSSIGITKATDRKTLADALEIAFHFDRYAMVERGVNCKEINCAAMRVDGKVVASACEQPVPWDEYLDFDSKYLHGGKEAKMGMQRQQRLLPAPIGAEMTLTIQEMTCRIYQILDCKGVVRVDFMIDQDSGELFVNEINTIPGSLAFYLMEAVGINFKELIDHMVEDAIRAHEEMNRNSFAYQSSILDHMTGGSKR